MNHLLVMQSINYIYLRYIEQIEEAYESVDETTQLDLLNNMFLSLVATTSTKSGVALLFEYRANDCYLYRALNIKLSRSKIIDILIGYNHELNILKELAKNSVGLSFNEKAQIWNQCFHQPESTEES